ncbi:MAG: hypothetical protein JO120_09090 [Solirubrobacterales bacterium]|nr:hypothetical protein [Solirubrobacterales bacterium]
MIPPETIDEVTIELIARRVADALRPELEAIAAQLEHRIPSESPLTVEDVAKRFGVARSTVYAHWHEWGGYRLGDSDKAPIRFESSQLPATLAGEQPKAAMMTRRRRRRRRDLISDAPRMDHRIEDVG